MKNLNLFMLLGYIAAGVGVGYTLTKRPEKKQREEDIGRVAIATVAGGLIGLMGAQIQFISEQTLKNSQQAKLNEGPLNPTA